MPTLTVAATTNFSANVLNNIDEIDFTNVITGATATFANTQFNNVAILDNVMIDGSTGDNNIVVNGGSVNASGWQFTNWNAITDDITLNGSGAVDTIVGSSQNDTINAGGGADFITGGLGADALNGSTGDDTYVYNNAAELVAGETIFDSSGTADTIQVGGFSGFMDFSGHSVSGIEKFRFINGTIGARFSSSQIAAGAIAQIDGGTAIAEIQIINETAIDLSGVTFTS